MALDGPSTWRYLAETSGSIISPMAPQILIIAATAYLACESVKERSAREILEGMRPPIRVRVRVRVREILEGMRPAMQKAYIHVDAHRVGEESGAEQRSPNAAVATVPFMSRICSGV